MCSGCSGRSGCLSPLQGWKAIEEPLSAVRGPTFEYRQQDSATDDDATDNTDELNSPLPSSSLPSSSLPSSALPAAAGASAGASVKTKTPVTLVFFIGGVTFGEIAALRALARRETNQRAFVIATSKIITGRSLMESCIELIENNLEK